MFVLLSMGGCATGRCMTADRPHAAVARSAAPDVVPPDVAPPRPWEEPERPALRPLETAPGGPVLANLPGEWVSWALLDRSTGELRTGGDPGTNSTESMVKAWIAADYLRGLGGRSPSASEVGLLSRMIRDSDDNAAEILYQRRGSDAVIRRMVATCGLTDTRIESGWWSLTQISARDAARVGDCVADDGTAGRWTRWLLDEMRQVRGEGRFGIVEVQPVPIKNGWTAWGGSWHVNCLGVADGWTLAVLTRYPSGMGLAHGAARCREVASSLP
jgi:hypothetical protein